MKIYNDPTELSDIANILPPGNAFIGYVPRAKLYLQLMEDRGIRVYPSTLSQMLTMSKVNQTHILKKWMHPLTFVIDGPASFFKAAAEFPARVRVVTKDDRGAGGRKVYFWDNVEQVYNHHCAHGWTPFVMQARIEEYNDVRVIICGDYVEAYERYNEGSRKNVCAGGTTHEWLLSNRELRICREVMAAANFPFAHLDLIIDERGEVYFSEISLFGGLKGSKIKLPELTAKKDAILEKLSRGESL